MTGNEWLQLVVYLSILLLSIKPLGLYMAWVYESQPFFMNKALGPIERGIYRLCRIDENQEMNWKSYAISMLIFNFFGILFVYGIQRLQFFLPLNPQSFSGVEPSLAFNTAASFATNTDWQAYGGENTLSYISQMSGLTVQNFLSAASGMSVLIALIRGLQRKETSALGNFWVDTIRGVLYIFLPLSIIFSLILVSQGVSQNFKDYQKVETLEKEEQVIPMGPVASQIAIKQLGTNGGGFFNVNSAHPFENPTPLTNFLELLAILLIPMALCYTFGVMVKNTRQGWTIFIAMFLIYLPLTLTSIWLEKQENPLFLKNNLNINAEMGNLEGKETRFGAFNSALWAVSTTATGNGSVNAMLDSFFPLSGLISLWLIDLGEVIFGGVGSGLAQMIIFVIITVFISGLMVGRTPEYLGKKIETYEMKMASFLILIMPLSVLIFTAIGLITEAGKASIANPGTHGFSEILYAFSSLTNNNGSAFAGLNANTFFYNTLGGIAILMGRYWIAIPMLAIAGSLAMKKTIPESQGTLPTDRPLFIVILICIVLIMGALTFFPSFALGPIVEHLMLFGD